MIANIYNVGPVTYPKVFQSDNGSELKVGVTRLLEKHAMMIQHIMTKFQQTHMAFIEAFNKLLAEQLFKISKGVIDLG